MQPKFVIEHLEKRLYRWCFLEYENISKVVGKKNLIFSNIKNKKDFLRLKKLGNVYEKSIFNLNLLEIKNKMSHSSLISNMPKKVEK